MKFTNYSYQALILILILSGPPILVSMILGLLVAIFQAATQIQEQTLSFTVKLFATIFTIIFLGGWLGGANDAIHHARSLTASPK